IAGGREIWGFPKKHADPTLEVVHDTLTGQLDYAGETVSIGTMSYKHENLIADPDEPDDLHPATILTAMGKTQRNLELIPHVDGPLAMASLVAYTPDDIKVKGAGAGPPRLHLIPRANAPVAGLPVRRIVGGRHFIADLSLPYGRVLFDYLKK